jgi:hypothetical protein
METVLSRRLTKCHSVLVCGAKPGEPDGRHVPEEAPQEHDQLVIRKLLTV